MTTDRELLELAAKAAGLTGQVVTMAGDEQPIFVLAFGSAPWPNGRFDPLTDDGDALRLAVKLEMLVDSEEKPFNRTNVLIGCWIDLDEPHGADRYAATRRAIVRAAAELGRRMA